MAYAIGAKRHAKLFRNGRSQAVRIPREFEFPEKGVIMCREGERLWIEPVKKKTTLTEWLATLEPLEEDFPEIPDLPPDPVEL